MMWMAFGAASGMPIGTLINDYNVGLGIGIGIAALCCAGDLLRQAWQHKGHGRLSWFD